VPTKKSKKFFLVCNKALSQNELEERLGAAHCYMSRVENGFTIPKLAKLERVAGALEAPVAEVVYDENPYPPPHLPVGNKCARSSGVVGGKDLRLLEPFNLFCLASSLILSRQLLVGLARRMTKRARL
jgi:transcriptional regulator with XRE-family HTH domain